MQPSSLPPTPFAWRIALAAVVVSLTVAARFGGEVLGARGQAALGVLCFLSIAALFSSNLRALNWRTLTWGFALQVLLALFVLKFEIFGVRPGYALFMFLGRVAEKFLAFSDEGAKFVFGKLAEPDKNNNLGVIFACRVLPTIVFVSSFFSVLYYFGILQWVVRLMARIMAYLLRTSGAETLSVSASVFMGQTEAPLMVKPYIKRMTRSELLTLMVGGMAHISGALMAVYIGLGADPIAILATSVMASPCSLYMAKLMLPEMEKPETLASVKAIGVEEQAKIIDAAAAAKDGGKKMFPETPQSEAPAGGKEDIEEKHANVIDAAAAGATSGMGLAINIAAMLIAFLAFIALFNYLLGFCKFERYPDGLNLTIIFGWIFEPVAYLLGVRAVDAPHVGNLLGQKLVLNEFVAYIEFNQHQSEWQLAPRTVTLVTYALTGFANIASIGIQLGGIGAMAPSRRPDLARLGPRALLTGFLVTLVNAAIAGVLLAPD